MENKKNDNRNYTTISPTAKVLLLMKGHTDIPFAREAAGIISRPETFLPDFTRKDFSFWVRVAHFESRYQQVDTLLREVTCRNILELSSGFSFRGLHMVKDQDIHFIDTDLPEVIAGKATITEELVKDLPAAQGKLETLPLNAMDEADFKSTIRRFEDGPVTIINEGLLMYLNLEEKKKLCKIIHDVLQERGGYWITADIYLKTTARQEAITPDDELQGFLDQHRIEENKFDNLEQAEAFFKENGFVVDKEADVDYATVGSVKYLLGTIPPDKLEGLKQGERIQAAWRLKIAD
jgi:O-methyltransferase involved in polyketide biosynthesis